MAPKSYKDVGIQYTKMVVEAALTGNWAGMKSLYNRACGITSPIKKIWLLDVDVINFATTRLGDLVQENGNMMARIPSKKGMHYIIKPFDIRVLAAMYQELGINITSGVEEVSLHKDNPTNLYIPEGAD